MNTIALIALYQIKTFYYAKKNHELNHAYWPKEIMAIATSLLDLSHN